MDRNEIMQFCISNLVIIVIIETIFIIAFIGWLTTKVVTITKRLNAFMLHTQSEAKKYNKNIENVDNHSYCIQQNTNRILKDMKEIEKILDRYKGEKFNTQINNKLSDEIAEKLLNNVCEDTKSIIDYNGEEPNSLDVMLKYQKPISYQDLSSIILKNNHNIYDDEDENCSFIEKPTKPINYEDTKNYEDSIKSDEKIGKINFDVAGPIMT